MNLITKALLFYFINIFIISNNAFSFEEILRKAAIDNGFKKSKELYFNEEKKLAEPGGIFFKSKKLSLNGNISCGTCHIDNKGSADGLPIAAAVGGTGEGVERFKSGARLLPRNTLPFWGRGAKGFDVFFWDGKVDASSDSLKSQFGTELPSKDPLIVAVHLPVVEIREMLDEDEMVESLKNESVEKAYNAYDKVAHNLKTFERDASLQLAKLLDKNIEDLKYFDFARAMTSFIREKFKLKETKFESFVYKNTKLSKDEIEGGLIFYGKGKCSVCHTGTHLSDFKFHNIIFPQLGFGRNGFGVDYGRYNITFDPKDLYKFRTPPLTNVEKTAPYGHDGSVNTMEESIIAHFDPLRLFDLEEMTDKNRHFLYQKISNSNFTNIGFLNDDEVNKLVKFLKTFTFKDYED